MIEQLQKTSDGAWFVYFVRAENGKLYCGISNDPVARFYKHCTGSGAKFFSTSNALALVYIEQCLDKSTALRREIQLKGLSKKEKERLVVLGCENFKLPVFYDESYRVSLKDIIL